MNKTQKIVKILNILRKEQTRTMLGDMSRKYNPFKILISTILSARSRDEVTHPLCDELFRKYPTAEKLAKAKPKEIEKLIKKIGFYKQKTKYIIGTAKKIVENKGRVPDKIEELTKLPGVGRKVAGCVMVYAHGKDAIPVDTHVHRISNRIGLVNTKYPEKTEQELMKITPGKYWQLVNELFVWYGKTTCKPITPECYGCKIIRYCDYKDKNLK